MRSINFFIQMFLFKDFQRNRKLCHSIYCMTFILGKFSGTSLVVDDKLCFLSYCMLTLFQPVWHTCPMLCSCYAAVMLSVKLYRCIVTSVQTLKLPFNLRELFLWVRLVCGVLAFVWSPNFLLEAHILLKFWPSSPRLFPFFSHTKILVTLLNW